MYLSVDPIDFTSSDGMNECDKIIKNRIEELRSEGFSEDEIFLMMIEESSKNNSMPLDLGKSTQKTKSIRFTYNSDIFNK